MAVRKLSVALDGAVARAAAASAKREGVSLSAWLDRPRGAASPQAASVVTYDTGALLAAEAGRRDVWALHLRALQRGQRPVVPAGVLVRHGAAGHSPRCPVSCGAAASRRCSPAAILS